LIVAVVFVAFVFAALAGSMMRLYVNWDISLPDNKKIYSGYLKENYSFGSKTKAAISTVNKVWNDGIVFKNEMINIFGLFQKIVGSRYVYDSAAPDLDVVKLDNGALTFIWPKVQNVKEKAEKISELNTCLKKRNINLLYIQAPYKINRSDKKLPAGVYDYTNENSDKMLSKLKERGVPTFDLREEIVKDGLDYDSLFFRTDHHWTPETGLWATSAICGRLNNDYGFKIDMSLLDKSNFSKNMYKNFFLGSVGKRVGKYYGGMDDFGLVLPKYKTDFSCSYYIPGKKNLTKSGSFKDAQVFMEELSKKDKFLLNAYGAYSGGDYALSVCINNKISGKRILLLRDSYSCVISPFLSLAACKELYAVDPRLFKGSIKDYIIELRPDIVLMLYNPGALADPVFFNF